MSSRILVALRVPGSPERVFEAFTSEVDLWWQDNPLFRFTRRSPGKLAFEPPANGKPGRFVERLTDGSTFEIGEVSVWEVGRRLVFGWRQASFKQDQHTWVEIDFEAVGAETRVTVQHHGWDSVPQAHVAKHTMPALLFDQRHGSWWRQLLGSLGVHVAGRG
jgi:uncharacterized protein YndB with AHSA1/START domain